MFIGVCGVGRMYSGHVGIGIAQFFLGWLTCGIWPMIDAFMMFSGSVKAGDGRPLRP
jgi:TM2 domain-containing membrane protein YozV